MPSNENVEWLNTNALRAYPLREDCQRHPLVGGQLDASIQLPNYVLVDFVVTVPVNTTTSVYCNRVAYVGGLLAFSFSNQLGVQIATVSLNVATHLRNNDYRFIGSGDYADTMGCVVVGDLTRLPDDFAEGVYEFTAGQMLMEARTVRPDLRGVRSIQTVSNQLTSDYLTGRIKFLAGLNTRITYVAPNTIRIDAISGQGLNEECDCAALDYKSNVVRTVNGIAIEDVTIMGDGQCIDVTTAGNKITIRDKCSEPCCDCPELQFLTQAMKVLDSTANRLDTYAQQLNDKITAFVTNYILTVIP